MWLIVLEGSFGFLFVLGVVTQLIWPLLTDAPLFPLLRKGHKRRTPKHKHRGMRKVEKLVDGEVVDIQHRKTGDGQ